MPGMPGVSHWRGHAALNGRSIGIEIVNPGHEWGYRDFPVLQLAAVCDLCLLILSRHPIPARNVVGHSDVAPDRKQDPGERFDWRALAENGVGLWPEDAAGSRHDRRGAGCRRLRPVRAALAEIGYRVGLEGALDPALSAVLRAFQRHWRPEAVTGQADDGTLVRLLGGAEGGAKWLTRGGGTAISPPPVGWRRSSAVEQGNHNPLVGGSNPSAATIFSRA